MELLTLGGLLFALLIGFLFGWFSSKVHYEKKRKKAGLF